MPHTKKTRISNQINRIILIGNGFDIAHGLKTSFKDFIVDYFKNVVTQLYEKQSYDDNLIKVTGQRLVYQNDMQNIGSDFGYYDFFMNKIGSKSVPKVWKSQFMKQICLEINLKKWVDIELEYFKILKSLVKISELDKIQKLNIELNYIKNLFLEYLQKQVHNYKLPFSNNILSQFQEEIYKKDVIPGIIKSDLSPNTTCLLNFNYTSCAKKY